MRRKVILAVLLVAIGLVGVRHAFAGQAPAAASDPDIPIGHQDRVYSAEQYSNTVSVTDPVDNRLVGTIRLGDSLPANLSPLYKGQLLVHGMGFSPDHRTIAVVAVGSNAVNFIDTATNSVKHVTYLGRSPHEAFYTMDGKEVWVTVRGENYVSVLDGTTYEEKGRIVVPNGPGMTSFSPDGKYGYVCSSFTPETEVVTVADHRIVGRVPQASPFCPNIAATPDSKQVWFTLKDTGKTQVFDAQPPFTLLKTLDTGPITNHVNIVRNAKGMFAYVTIGGLNEIKVFRTDDFEQVATIPVGKLPHGIWPSGDGTRVYVGLENEDKVAVIDTLTNQVIATSPVGQAPQALVYVPDAVPAMSGGLNEAMTRMTVAPEGLGTNNLQPLGIAGQSTELSLVPPGANKEAKAPTSVSLSDQGLVQILEAAVTGLEPGKPYLLALASEPSGTGVLEPLQGFMTNPAGAAVVNAIGPIRQLVRSEDKAPRRYLVILPGTPGTHGTPVQIQKE
ncbi:YncE family protein [Bradyrhizobium sp. Pear77]|uniref:YncE family protein n=1 Tax=Bradyrhizobium altum TaxID=1571202 RepID=UPI001E595D38|nr:YncE family protein [Bradyrhizobium altum]MCC8953237.1 YncE family protein [Bradyrhizobium altum]